VEERPQRVLAEALVEAVEDVLGQERRDAAEGANVEDLHVVGEAVAEVEEERVLVLGEVPAEVVRAALAAHGERTARRRRRCRRGPRRAPRASPASSSSAAVRDVENATKMFDLMPSGTSVLVP
jgi:hypothetical protein